MTKDTRLAYNRQVMSQQQPSSLVINGHTVISTFIRQYGRHIIKDTGQTYKCNQAHTHTHQHTHRQAHPIKTIKQTNSYRRLTASVAKCLLDEDKTKITEDLADNILGRFMPYWFDVER